MNTYVKDQSISPPKGGMDKTKPKKKLNYYKCEQCRNDRQRCDDEPEKRHWPGTRCHRCIKYNYPCGENVDSEGKSMPMRKTIRYTPSPSPGPYGSANQSHSHMSLTSPAPFYSPAAHPRGQSPNYDPFNDASYNPDYQPEYTHPTAAGSPATSRSLSSHGYPALDGPLQTPSLTPISRIHFTWLHNYQFSAYVRHHLGQEGVRRVATFYGMIELRRRTIQEHDNRLMMHGSVYPMVLQYQQQYQNQQDQYMASYGTSANGNYYQTQPSLPQSFLAGMTVTERTGMRWRELIEEMRCEEILLIDPHWSSGFVITLEHGTDEEFYRAKRDVCALGSESREMCLRLSGVTRMIEQLQEGKGSLRTQVREYMATEIERRITDAIPLIEPVPSKTSSHGSLDNVQESSSYHSQGLQVEYYP